MGTKKRPNKTSSKIDKKPYRGQPKRLSKTRESSSDESDIMCGENEKRSLAQIRHIYFRSLQDCLEDNFKNYWVRHIDQELLNKVSLSLEQHALLACMQTRIYQKAMNKIISAVKFYTDRRCLHPEVKKMEEVINTQQRYNQEQIVLKTENQTPTASNVRRQNQEQMVLQTSNNSQENQIPTTTKVRQLTQEQTVLQTSNNTQENRIPAATKVRRLTQEQIVLQTSNNSQENGIPAATKVRRLTQEQTVLQTSNNSPLNQTPTNATNIRKVSQEQIVVPTRNKNQANQIPTTSNRCQENQISTATNIRRLTQEQIVLKTNNKSQENQVHPLNQIPSATDVTKLPGFTAMNSSNTAHLHVNSHVHLPMKPEIQEHVSQTILPAKIPSVKPISVVTPQISQKTVQPLEELDIHTNLEKELLQILEGIGSDSETEDRSLEQNNDNSLKEDHEDSIAVRLNKMKHIFGVDEEMNEISDTQTTLPSENPKDVRQDRQVRNAWFHEKNIQMYHLSTAMQSMNSLQRCPIKETFSLLFGPDSDEEHETEYLSNKTFIDSCIERIIPWVVGSLMPYYKQKLIVGRSVFKGFARFLSEKIVLSNFYPDELEVQQIIASYFSQGQTYTTEADIWCAEID